MTTRATRDVLNLKVRSVEDIVVDGKAGSRIDNVPIGTVQPHVGHFTNLFADTLTLTNPLQISVVHDDTLSGDGTTSSPLSVVDHSNFLKKVHHDASLSGDGTAASPLKVVASNDEPTVDVGFVESTRTLTVTVNGVSDTVTIAGGSVGVSNVSLDYASATKTLSIDIDGKTDSVVLPISSLGGIGDNKLVYHTYSNAQTSNPPPSYTSSTETLRFTEEPITDTVGINSTYIRAYTYARINGIEIPVGQEFTLPAGIVYIYVYNHTVHYSDSGGGDAGQ